jgi:hypothetical protein
MTVSVEPAETEAEPVWLLVRGPLADQPGERF